MFPKGFVWGAGSSAYQIEGASGTDERGQSVWDVFCHRPGAVHGGHTGDVACDHYHRYLEDVAMMRRIGLQAYRFSISWPRVLPDGIGRINKPGLDFYDRLVDALLAAGIQPWVTLFHWDFPQALFRSGGWLSRESPEWFAEYTRVVVDRLSDRVTNWITLNEPQIFLGLGHGTGIHAPGLKLPFSEQLLATHHALMAHGRSVSVIRSRAKLTPTVGWAPVGRVEYPATSSVADIDAACRSTFSVTKRDMWSNTWFADPVCLGHYPEDGIERFGEDVPQIQPGDMEIIHQPLDFYGVNIYSGEPVAAGPEGEPVPVPRPPGFPQTSMRWPVAPESLYWGPRFLFERYKLPVVITENGMANLDWLDESGQVKDYQRIDYTSRYLKSLAQAAADGVDVRGYFHWSIMDNFEWAEGYKERFGLVYVDYPSLKRTLKESAHWYSKVIASNGTSLGALPRPAASELAGRPFVEVRPQQASRSKER
jgi:beta-glucosidase